MQEERYIAAVDLGSSKIALSVAKVFGEDVQVIYYKETPSDGIRNSCVINPKKAAAPLRKAIDEAEEELGIKILQVVIGLPRYGVKQDIAKADITRTEPGSCITADEIRILKEQAIDTYPLDDVENEEIYGAVAQSFSADDELVNASESEIIGVAADKIVGNFKVFIGRLRSMTNIDIMLNDVNVACTRKLFLPSSTAQAVLTESEKENGVALVEFGAGVTSLTVYKNNLLRHYSSIPFGGKTVTKDIAYECGFTEDLAENIKLAFGASMPGKLQSLSEKVIQINDDENGSYEQLPVKYLSEVITYREEEIINAILYQLQESGYADSLRNGVVITGGGANMVNIANYFKEMSGYTVRIGYPRTRLFTSDGCPGINETSAVSSIGMLLEASRDSHLNCIVEEAVEIKPASQEIPVQTPAQEPSAEESEGVKTPATPVILVTKTGAKDQASSDGPSIDERGNGSLFTGDKTYESEVIQPKRTKTRTAAKPSTPHITWLSKLKKKVGDAIEGTFDSTMGQLFDDMENFEEKK